MALIVAALLQIAGGPIQCISARGLAGDEKSVVVGQTASPSAGRRAWGRSTPSCQCLSRPPRHRHVTPVLRIVENRLSNRFRRIHPRRIRGFAQAAGNIPGTSKPGSRLTNARSTRDATSPLIPKYKVYVTRPLLNQGSRFQLLYETICGPILEVTA